MSSGSGDEERGAGPIAHALSHELRSPLSTISYCCELLRGRIDDDPDAEEYLARIRRMLREVETSLDGFVEYADRVSEPVELESVEIGPLVDDVVEELDARAGAGSAEIIRDDLPRVRGEARSLRELFHHLLDNALRHGRHDGPARVRLDAVRDGDRWVIRIDDAGPGVVAADRERVFGLFERGDGAGDDPRAGIGLPACRLIARRHGGRIWIEESPAGGARVAVELPAPTR